MLFEVFFAAFPLNLGAQSYVSQGSLKVSSVTVPHQRTCLQLLSYLSRELVEGILKLTATEPAPADVQKLGSSTLAKLVIDE